MVAHLHSLRQQRKGTARYRADPAGRSLVEFQAERDATGGSAYKAARSWSNKLTGRCHSSPKSQQAETGRSFTKGNCKTDWESFSEMA